MEVDRKPFAFSLFLASDETVLYLGRFFLLRCCASSSLSTLLDDNSFWEKGEHVSLSVTDVRSRCKRCPCIFFMSNPNQMEFEGMMRVVLIVLVNHCS